MKPSSPPITRPSPAEFWDIAAKGNTLRRLHLMDPAAIGSTPYPYQGGRRRRGGPTPPCRWARALGFEDVKHYQRIIKILAETDRIMKTITLTLNGQ